MPRFTNSEKAIIKEKLRVEGERLFITHGKKVTIDDLIKATGIAKGSFYAFYTNKEHLYMDIAGILQQKMWSEMDKFLEEHRSRYPFLKQADSETVDYLHRELPKDIIEEHTNDDSHELMKLQEYGVKFKCGIELATKALQTLAISLISVQDVF